MKDLSNQDMLLDLKKFIRTEISDSEIRLGGRIDKLEMAIDRLDTRLGSVETKVDSLETKVDTLDSKVDNNHEEMKQIIADVSQEILSAVDDVAMPILNDHEKRLNKIEGKRPLGLNLMRPKAA